MKAVSEQSQSAAPANHSGDAVLFAERLWVPWWWWPVAFAITAILAAEITMGAPGIRAWLPYVLLLPLPTFVLIWLSRLRVDVVALDGGGRELRVGRAHMPVDVIARGALVPATAKSSAMGRQLDPAAYVQHRPWVKEMVLAVLDDPDDPTPYWLVSTRRPEQLLVALGLPEQPQR